MRGAPRTQVGGSWDSYLAARFKVIQPHDAHIEAALGNRGVRVHHARLLLLLKRALLQTQLLEPEWSVSRR